MNDPMLTASLVQETFWQRDDRFALVAFKAKTAEDDLQRLGLPRMPVGREFYKERGDYWIKVGVVNTAEDQGVEHYGIRLTDSERWNDRYILTMGGQLLWNLARTVCVIGTPHCSLVKETPRDSGVGSGYIPGMAIDHLPILSHAYGELIVGFQFAPEHLPGQPGVGRGGCKDDWAIRV